MYLGDFPRFIAKDQIIQELIGLVFLFWVFARQKLVALDYFLGCYEGLALLVLHFLLGSRASMSWVYILYQIDLKI